MKIIHTSDWHLGHALYNYDRTEEQASMLQQMVEIVGEEQPDVFLISGDVYHTGQPSSAVQTLFAETMVSMHDACPKMQIVVTAGNHDSGSKLDIFHTPWRVLGVHTFGSLSKEDPASRIVALPGVGFVVAVPYCAERHMPENYFQQLLDLVSEQNPDQLPVVLSAHTTVRGCDFAGHDHATDLNVGGIDAFDIKQMGQGYDYLALGHIHHQQFIHTGNHNVRYCGSPLPVSFDESYPHSVSVVTIESHGRQPIVNEVEIKNPRPLVTLPAHGVASWDEARSLLMEFPADNPAYIRLNVMVDAFLPPDAQQEAQRICADKQCRFCVIKVSRPHGPESNTPTFTVEQFHQQRPIDIARRFAQDSGIEFTPEMEKMFDEVLQSMNN